jgi:hypothetical protein
LNPLPRVDPVPTLFPEERADLPADRIRHLVPIIA